MESKKILLYFPIMIFICSVLFSCSDADIIVSNGEKIISENISAESTEEIFALTVNISSGVFHIDESCRYAVNIKEENKKTLLYSDIRIAIEDGYSPCSACAKEYKD